MVSDLDKNSEKEATIDKWVYCAIENYVADESVSCTVYDLRKVLDYERSAIIESIERLKGRKLITQMGAAVVPSHII